MLVNFLFILNYNINKPLFDELLRVLSSIGYKGLI